jgi:ABC-type lipoprotein export system ATPase subunit
LLLDEPTAHLDDERAAQVAGELSALAKEGRAVLVATHDPRVAQSPAVTRVLDLAHGRIAPRAPETAPSAPEAAPPAVAS